MLPPPLKMIFFPVPKNKNIYLSCNLSGVFLCLFCISYFFFFQIFTTFSRPVFQIFLLNAGAGERVFLNIFTPDFLKISAPVVRRGESALHLAAQGGLATLTTALLVAGADPNLQTGQQAAESSGGVWRQTALHLALIHQQEAVVSCLLEFSQSTGDCGLATLSLDINLKNSADETPLGLVLTRPGLRHLAALMLAAGADVDVRDAAGLTLLQKAIGERNKEGALFLLQHGADINLRTPQGLTPLELAVRNRADEVGTCPCLSSVVSRWNQCSP